MEKIQQYVSRFGSIQKWFRRGKKPYTFETMKVYVNYMQMFCNILHKTPDQIISDIRDADRPIDEIENTEKKLAFYMITKIKLRSIQQRLNAFHSFLRANGIRLTPEIMKQVRSKIVTHRGLEHLSLRKLSK